MTKFKVGIPLYPGFDLLDVAGSYQTFTMADMDCQLIGPDTCEAVKSWEGACIQPTKAFADYEKPDKKGPDPKHPDTTLDMLFVPGGEYVVKKVIVGNDPCVEFLVEHKDTDWICSVCTGALVLGAAGLLEGYTCTTHWAYKEVLRLFPDVTVVDDYRRHVHDRNRITGAGISSSIDESLYITSVILGLDVARTCQLKMQYRPEPIMHCGDPGDSDIRDRPGMVREVLDHWQVDQAATLLKDWLAD
jgi:cyclohexyl-isocyanide hydratase